MTVTGGGRVTIVDTKQQEGRCKKGHRSSYYLSPTEFMRAKGEENDEDSEAADGKPLESHHELMQSLGLWDWCQKICLTCSLPCQDLFLQAKIATVESCLPREKELKWIPSNVTMTVSERYTRQ
jgi:hypothetical protein